MPLNPLPLVVQGLTMLTGFLEKKKRERERIQSPGESYVQRQKKATMDSHPVWPSGERRESTWIQGLFEQH